MIARILSKSEYAELRDRVRAAMAERQISPSALARQMGHSRHSIQHAVAPSGSGHPTQLRRIAAHLGIEAIP